MSGLCYCLDYHCEVLQVGWTPMSGLCIMREFESRKDADVQVYCKQLEK